MYGVIILFTYGWTLYRFVWKLPSWLINLTIKEIFIGLCYALTTNLFESLVVLTIILIPALIFPNSKWSLEFVFRASTFVGIVLFTFIRILKNDALINDLPAYGLYAIAATALLQFVLIKLNWFHNLIIGFAERTIVFIYFLLPPSLVAAFFLGIRRLWI